MDELLAVEKAFCENNRDAFKAKYLGHYLLVQAEEVHGDFETRDEAVLQGVELFGSGPFLVWSPLETRETELALSVPALTVGVPLVADSPFHLPA